MGLQNSQSCKGNGACRIHVCEREVFRKFLEQMMSLFNLHMSSHIFHCIILLMRKYLHCVHLYRLWVYIVVEGKKESWRVRYNPIVSWKFWEQVWWEINKHTLKSNFRIDDRNGTEALRTVRDRSVAAMDFWVSVLIVEYMIMMIFRHDMFYQLWSE